MRRNPSNRARTLALLLLASLASLPVAVRAQEPKDDPIVYRVRQGDTLLSLSQAYFVTPGQYRGVQTSNRIADPRRIPVGTQLTIPRAMLRSNPTRLVVANFSGPVEIVAGTYRGAPRKGMEVPEGAVIQTGPNGFVSFAGERGSLATLPSQTRARISRARQYVLNNMLDVEFEILRGRGEFQPPKLQGDDRYRVRTPRATAAVRGTVFRRSVSESDGLEGTEVIEGTVAMASGSQAADVPAGFGQTVSAAGLGAIEDLLPPPALAEPAKVQTDEALGFTMKPVTGAVGYRLQIARDAGFVDMVDETSGEGLEQQLAGQPNGNYFVRIRAIAPSRLEGEPETYSFRRQRLGVAASAKESPLGNGYKFNWNAVGAESALFDFKLWRDGNEAVPLVSELGMDKPGLILTDLAPGTYYWRVAAVSPGPEGVLRVWGPPQRLIVAK